MGILWMGAFALYGMSATFLGALDIRRMGPAADFMIMTADAGGSIDRRVEAASRSAKLLLSSGICS